MENFILFLYPICCGMEAQSRLHLSFFITSKMAVSFGSKGIVNAVQNDLRFLDQLDLVYDYKIETQAFLVPIIKPEKLPPPKTPRHEQWYEQYCCTKPAVRSRKRKSRAKRPAPVQLEKSETKPAKMKRIVCLDDCLQPLIPMANPMTWLHSLEIAPEPPTLPSGIRAIRVVCPPSTWNRPGVLQRPAPVVQPPWAHSVTELWHQSASLQPGCARNLVRLGRMLQEIGSQQKKETEELVAMKGGDFAKQIERQCLSLGRLTNDCVRLLERQGKRVET